MTKSDKTFRLASDDDFESESQNLDAAVTSLQSAIVPQPQEQARRRILDFCQANPDALHRSCLEGHLTASTFVVDLPSRSVALIHHKKLGLWLQPGGHADGEGNLLKVAATEVAEEVGLTNLAFVVPAFDIDIHAIPARGDVPAHHHLDLRFLAIARDRPTIDGNDETNDAGWVDLDDSRMGDGDAVANAAFRAVQLAISF